MVEMFGFPEKTHAGSGSPINHEHVKNKLLITINPDFKKLVPPLSQDEYNGLEVSILKDGCRDPLVIWDNTIIDGHNRYEICCKHDIRFNTKTIEFEDNQDARIWMFRNQLNRRNLSDVARIDTAMALKDELEDQAAKKSKSNLKQFQVTDNQESTDCSVRNSPQELFENETDQQKQDRWNNNRVNAQIADIAGVSTAKVFRYRSILDHGTPEEIELVKSGGAKICPTYDRMVERHKTEASFCNFPQEKYRVVYADLYERDIDSSVGWSSKRNTSEVRSIPIKGFLEECAVCFLWSPPNYLTETLIIMNNWGFKYATSFVIESEPVRTSYNSLDHMLVLVGAKNGCAPDIKKRFSSVLDKQKFRQNRYSKFRNIIEEMYLDGNKIEFFPEHNALGWDQYQEETL